MSWLDQQPIEVLRAAILHSPSCFLFSTFDGRMLWANDSFLSWIGYTQSEIQSRTWMEISVKDQNLEADLEAARRLADGYQQTYIVQKQYIPKNSRPKWGTLFVMRYPPMGDISMAICVWEPMVLDTEIAFQFAKEGVAKMETELAELRRLLEQAEATSLVEKAMLIGMKLVITYPKTSTAVFMFCCLVVGGNAALDAMQNVKKLMNPLAP